MLVVGGEDHYLNFVGDRFSLRAPAFTSRNDGRVKVDVVRVGELDDVNKEIFADLKAKVYDGYVFLPFITGSLVEQNGLADLTDFVRTNQDINWPDIFPFNRDVQSVYNNVVRVLPCDGECIRCFIARTCLSSTMCRSPAPGTNTRKLRSSFTAWRSPTAGSTMSQSQLSGSCVERKEKCHEPDYFNMLVHATTTQAKGTLSGALLDPFTFEPLMGEAMAETLRHLENQVLYGDSEGTYVGSSTFACPLMSYDHKTHIVLFRLLLLQNSWDLPAVA